MVAELAALDQVGEAVQLRTVDVAWAIAHTDLVGGVLEEAAVNEFAAVEGCLDETRKEQVEVRSTAAAVGVGCHVVAEVS